MNNFMIGMHGKYDFEKYNRDFREDFYGVQVCLLQNETEVDNLYKEAERIGFKIGIHFPLRDGITKFRDPQFMSNDPAAKAKAYRHIEEELNYIMNKKIKPEYILFHYPKPVILKEDFDMSNWRFADRSEYTYESDYSFDQFKTDSEYLFNWLTEKSIEYDFVPVLEFDALNKYICRDNFLEELLDKYKGIKLCLDTGRLHLQKLIDKDFDDIDVIKRFVKYTEVIHLWNERVPIVGHYPALPSLKEEDGWAPIETYLNLIQEGNKQVKIMFEHRSDLISDNELNSCYSWVASIFK